jgi:plasmid stabilization system protein ParE
MVYKIIWSPRALEDLREVVQYIRRDKPIAARQFGEKLIAKAESLTTFPERGGIIKKFADPNLRQVFQGPYRIAYRIRTEFSLIEIARIWHGARNDENFEL